MKTDHNPKKKNKSNLKIIDNQNNKTTLQKAKNLLYLLKPHMSLMSFTPCLCQTFSDISCLTTQEKSKRCKEMYCRMTIFWHLYSWKKKGA